MARGAQRGDFPPDVFLVTRRPPPVAVAGGYRDAAGIESTVTVIGVKALRPLTRWRLALAIGFVCAGSIVGVLATRAGVSSLWFVVIGGVSFCLFSVWSSRDRSSRIEVDWQRVDVLSGRWPWRRTRGLALADVVQFAAAEDGPRYRVVARRSDESSWPLCDGIAQRESADFIARTLEALRTRSGAIGVHDQTPASPVPP